METKTAFIRFPEPTIKQIEKLKSIDKRLNQSEVIRYLVYRGLESFNKHGIRGLEPQAQQDIKKYIRFLDGLNSMTAEPYVPGVMPTVATFEEQEKQLDKLNEA